MFSMAFAQGTASVSNAAVAPVGADFLQMGLPVVFMLALYFLVIRPNSKKMDEQKKMVETLKIGDEVVTAAGLMGIISELQENHILLKVADTIVLMIQRQSIQHILPKGTIKFSTMTKYVK